MLLYNQRKEFIGVDNESLNELGFLNIAELQNEAHDFADLFVKKPGFIHNFKNFSWIDFILHSESADDPKAVIHAKGKNFACNLHVTPFSFLSEESGFAIALKNLRLLKGAEDEQASKDLQAAGGIQASAAAEPTGISSVTEKRAPETDISFDDVKSPAPEVQTPQSPTPEPELPNFDESYTQELSEPEPLDIPEAQEIDLGFTAQDENEFGAPVDIDYNAPLTLDDDVMKDIEEPSFEEEAPAPFDESQETQAQEAPMLGDYVSSNDSEYLSDLIRSGEYVYDPKIAADELGLPVDLIEEFIGDFIDQAREFHDDLFASVKAGDFDNVQNLSHKLKGVAANLRVEDAFDTLAVINSSKDIDEILPNLNYFYTIIAKLAGEEVPQAAFTNTPTQETVSTPSLQEETDDLNIEIKQPEDGPLLIDEETLPSSDDETYDNLLASSEEKTSTSEPSIALEEEEDDIYGDLLASPQEVSTPEPEPSIVNEEQDDDIYGDLLASSEEESYVPETEVETSLPTEEDDDIYGDLLSTEDTISEHDDSFEIPVDTSFDEAPFIEPESNTEEDLYMPTDDIPVVDEVQDEAPFDTSDDLLSHEEVTPPVKEVATLNFDAQRTADELGIPLDIVNEFVQDFKEQVHSHQNDFDEAITREDISKINQTATLLKGMSDNLRLNEISEVLKELQQANNINDTTQALATLHAYVDQI